MVEEKQRFEYTLDWIRIIIGVRKTKGWPGGRSEMFIVGPDVPNLPIECLWTWEHADLDVVHPGDMVQRHLCATLISAEMFTYHLNKFPTSSLHASRASPPSCLSDVRLFITTLVICGDGQVMA